MTAAFRHPREASVVPMRATIFKDARKVAMSAGSDWPRLLGAAQTLSASPDWTDTSLARHIREAYSLHLADLLHPVDPTHRDRSDRLDQWKEAAIRCEEEETPLRVAMRHKGRWPTILIGGGFWAAIMLALSGWV
jgi:hypothetical protein